ncbi:unnamed protein product, partial [marine sediment metagenome]
MVIKITTVQELVSIGITNKKLLDDLIKWDFKDNLITPEGKTRISWIIKLNKKYGYSYDHMAIEVPMRQIGRRETYAYADLVIYRKAKPFIVFEFKAEGHTEGIEQAESYARQINAEFWVWSRGIERIHDTYYRRTRYDPQPSEKVPNIPQMIDSKPFIKPLSRKGRILTPFRDEQEIREVFEDVERVIVGEGKISIFLFSILSILINLKIFDERDEETINYNFTVLANESDKQVYDKMQALYERAKKDRAYHDLISPSVKFSFSSKEALRSIVMELMYYDFTETMHTLKMNDILGIAYEEIVGKSFRGDLGQHFTPRQIVEFLTQMIDFSSNDKIYDPACGSAGFLLSCIKEYRQKLIEHNPNLNPTRRELKVQNF